MKLAVRCCCTPRKVLGWVNVPDRAFSGYTFALRPDATALPLPGDTSAPLDPCVYLEKAAYIHDDGSVEWAFKSMDLPIETLCRIAGFEKNYIK